MADETGLEDGPRKAVKVFGIGLNKTGTKSLRTALRRTGHRHYMPTRAVVQAGLKGDLPVLIDAMNRHDSAEDWPWPLRWREMRAHYGRRARFILTRRVSAEVWLDSLRRWSLRTHPGSTIRRQIYGHDYPHGAEQVHLDYYNRHLDEVREAFHDAPGQLLEICFEQGHGYPEICAFLGEDIPRKPLPHRNAASRNEPNPDWIDLNRTRAEAQRDRLLAQQDSQKKGRA